MSCYAILFLRAHPVDLPELLHELLRRGEVAHARGDPELLPGLTREIKM